MYHNPTLNLYSQFLNCQQGTPQWHSLRENSIGGSSAAVVIDKHSYKSREEFIKERATGVKCVDSPNYLAMAHGTLMEDLNRQVASSIIGTTIFSAGICVSTNGMHFSPDGIGYDLAGRMFLCEFKTPYSRRIIRSKRNIHMTYQMQMQHSMGILRFDYCLFQDLICIYSLNSAELNPKNRLDSLRPYGTFSTPFYCPSLPSDKMYTLSDVNKKDLPAIMNTAIQTAPSTISYMPNGLQYINQMRCELYNTNKLIPAVPLSATFSEFIGEYTIKPNMLVTGLFGPVRSYILQPDLEVIRRLRSGCEKTLNDIKTRKELLRQQGLMVAN